MLLFSRNIGPELRFAAWKIEEEEQFFRKEIPLAPAELSELERHQHPTRRLEWLAGRWLLHQLTGVTERLPMTKTPYSKPFFIDAPQLYCSLSHSQGIVAALLSNTECGCDIQVLVDKMPRIAPKFMRSDEFEWVDSDEPAHRFEIIHLFWTAKEAMYKAWGLKELDFRQHLSLEPFAWKENETMLTRGHIRKGEKSQTFQLYLGMYETEGYQFAWTVCDAL